MGGFSMVSRPVSWRVLPMDTEYLIHYKTKPNSLVVSGIDHPMDRWTIWVPLHFFPIVKEGMTLGRYYVGGSEVLSAILTRIRA